MDSMQGVSLDGLFEPVDDPSAVAVFGEVPHVVRLDRADGPDDMAEGVVIDRVQLPVLVLP